MERTLDASGVILVETQVEGLLQGLSLSHGFDPYLRRTNVVLLGSGSAVLASPTNSFDPAGRMKVVGSGAASATYSYLANSPLVEQSSFANNGVAVMNTVKNFDALNRLTNIVSSTNGVALSKHSYLYNSANQRTRATLVEDSYWVYSYDGLGQVTSGRKYWSDGSPVAGQQFEYGFDTIGNRKTSASGGDEFGTSLRRSDYSGNSLNQYTNRTAPGFVNVIGTANASATVSLWGDNGSWSPTTRKGEYFRGELSANNSTGAVWLTITNVAVLKSGNTDIITNTIGKTFLAKAPQEFCFDLDGNLTNDANWMCTWDAENRLTRMVANTPTGPQQRIDFAYDWQGRRVSKRVWNNTAGTGSLVADLKFVYDGWNLIAELNATNNAVIRSYIWGSDLSGTLQGAGGVGGLLAVCDAANGTHFPVFDGNGNVMAMASAADGTISAEYEFGPFGELLRATGPMAMVNPFRFSTKYQDDETGLLYYGYRYYDPSTGRWNSRDPMEEEGGHNLYAFTANAPQNWADVLGLCGVCCCCADDIKITNHKKITVTDKKGNRGIGNSFDTIINLSYKVWSEKKDCTLKWMEKANRDVPELDLKAGQWTDQYLNPKQKSTFDKSWGSRTEPCPGAETVKDHDAPAIGLKSRARVMWFKIIVESAEGCPCDHKSVEVTARQFLNPYSDPVTIDFQTPAPE